MRKKFLVKQKYLLILKSKKMKNLKNLNLVELNAQEVKKIEGGLILWTKTIVGYLLSEFDSILEGNAAWKREHGIK